jgi:hypothetical protein
MEGADRFMSLDQFKKFYWPTLKELLLGLINEGLTPVVLVEGHYDCRPETISDVPMSLLSTGTVDQIKLEGQAT